MYYRLNYKAATKQIALESGAGGAPALIATWTDGGTFRHDHSTDVLGDNPEVAPDARFGENHTLFHHIQKYFDETFGRVDGLTYDLSRWAITVDALRSLSIGVGDIEVAANADSADITVTPTPANASLEGLEWVSSDETKATVIPGTAPATQVKVHGVAAGASTLVASVGAINSNTRNITVTA